VSAQTTDTAAGADIEAGLTPLEYLAAEARRAPVEKLEPALRALAESESKSQLYVVLYSTSRLELDGIAEFAHQWTWPAGEHLAIVRVSAKSLLTLAALPGVARIESGDTQQQKFHPMPDDPDVQPAPQRADPAVLRAQLDAAPSWSETEARIASRNAADVRLGGKGSEPAGWFDVGPGHSAREAWDLGYTGEGVRVAVVDTAVDFAHYDLMGTWAVMPEGSMYAGWPQVYDPLSMQRWALEQDPEVTNDFTGRGQSGIVRFDLESTIEPRDFGGTMIASACAPALVGRPNPDNPNATVIAQDPESCDWRVPDGLSKSGTVRMAYGPDLYLRSLGANVDADIRFAYAMLLLVDANEAGVYDTLYVDVNQDRDFRDEKPMTKASPLGWRDIDGDDIPDMSGGLLYWIADGATPPPGAYLWGLEDVVPEQGRMIAIHSDFFSFPGSSHGTLCASNVASQGRLGVPSEVNLSFTDLPGGKPEALNPGMAPDAQLVSVGFALGSNLSLQSGWIYGVFGSDKDVEGDEIQVTSNSYGNSGVDNDGFDLGSRTIDYYVRTYQPSVVSLFSTGNGGPGYGTLAPPSPATGLGIAASTQFGSTGWDSIAETSQIVYGDITPFSNRGPGADGRPGPSIAANGAYAAGASNLNFHYTTNAGNELLRTGDHALQTWGGTSRSSPIAAGHTALMYQAFKEKNGRWPTWEEAGAIMMAGARYNGYDSFTVGAGVADAADSVRIASGQHGAYAVPPEWTAGDYRGERHNGFAKVVHPGSSSTGKITLNNPSDEPLTITLSGRTLRRISSYDESLTTQPITSETKYTFLAPDYLIPIDQSKVPEGTELMVVRGTYGLEQFDSNRDYFMDNNWRLAVYRHTDLNDNGILWTDENQNGVVDNVEIPGQTQALDRYTALDYEASEIEQYEYMRMSYDSGATNSWGIPIHHPLERWGAGLYIGLWHRCTSGEPPVCNGRTAAVPQTDLTFRIDFYQHEDWDWLSVGDESVTVPAGAAVDVDVTLSVPGDAPFGAYQGAIFADYPRGEGDVPVPTGGGYELPHQRIVIPVNANVAAQFEWTGRVDLGAAVEDDRDAPYNNGIVGGFQNWQWRPETGDWRFFFVDAAEPPAGAHWVVRTTWDDTEGQSDIDTVVLGPTDDVYSSQNPDPEAEEDTFDPAWYGPYRLETKVRSVNRLFSGGTWLFDTTSGSNEDWLATPGDEGLHEILLHNVLFSGSKQEVPFNTVIASARLHPSPVLVREESCTPLTLTTGIDMPGFDVRSFGLSKPQIWPDYEFAQDDQEDPSTASFKQAISVTENTYELSITVSGEPDVDLDLFLLRDLNSDGVFSAADDEIIADSTTPTSQESIVLRPPEPGAYMVWVQGWDVPMGTTRARVEIDALGGDRVLVNRTPGEIEPDVANVMDVCLDAGDPVEAGMRGVIFMGPAGAPDLFTVQVRTIADTIHLPSVANGAAEPAAPEEPTP
jgi:subtilisin family serine protease